MEYICVSIELSDIFCSFTVIIKYMMNFYIICLNQFSLFKPINFFTNEANFFLDFLELNLIYI